MTVRTTGTGPSGPGGGGGGRGDRPFDPALLAFVYPWQRETALPAKVTATQLKGRPVDQEIAENAAHTPYLRPLSQPAFRRERQGLTPAERGTAAHLVLQYLDFSDFDVAGQIEALRQRGLLTDQQAAAVETAPLERFLRPPWRRRSAGARTSCGSTASPC